MIKPGHPLYGYKYPETSVWTCDEIQLYYQALLKYDKDFLTISKQVRCTSKLLQTFEICFWNNFLNFQNANFLTFLTFFNWFWSLSAIGQSLNLCDSNFVFLSYLSSCKTKRSSSALSSTTCGRRSARRSTEGIGYCAVRKSRRASSSYRTGRRRDAPRRGTAQWFAVEEDHHLEMWLSRASCVNSCSPTHHLVNSAAEPIRDQVRRFASRAEWSCLNSLCI